MLNTLCFNSDMSKLSVACLHSESENRNQGGTATHEKKDTFDTATLLPTALSRTPCHSTACCGVRRAGIIRAKCAKCSSCAWALTLTMGIRNCMKRCVTVVCSTYSQIQIFNHLAKYLKKHNHQLEPFLEVLADRQGRTDCFKVPRDMFKKIKLGDDRSSQSVLRNNPSFFFAKVFAYAALR